MTSSNFAGQLRRLAALTSADQWVLVRAATAVAAIRFALWMLPFRWVCALVCSLSVVRGTRGQPTARTLEWSVRVVGRRIPSASCLTQALALRWLLVRAGHPATLRIGIAKDSTRDLAAHAWVESCAERLLDAGREADSYLPIATLPRASA